MMSFLFQTFKGWSAHATQDKAAALTYYTLLAFPPLTLLLLQLAKAIVIFQVPPQELVAYISRAFPADTGEFVTQFTLRSLDATNIWLTIASTFFLIWSASALIDALERAVNSILEVRIAEEKQNIWRTLQRKTVSILVLLSFCLVLLISFLLPPLLAFFFPTYLVQISDSILSLLVLTGIFSILLRYLAYIQLAWKDVLLCASVLALMTFLGKELLSYLFSFLQVANDFSVGASIVLFLVWVFYTASIILLGIEGLGVWVRRGEKISLKDFAQSLR